MVESLKYPRIRKYSTTISVGRSGDVAEAVRQMTAPRRIPLPCGDIVSEGLLWTPTRIPSRTGALVPT